MRPSVFARIGAPILCGMLFAAPVGAGTNTWTTQGPPGGSFRVLEVSPTNRDVLYAGYLQNIFRSTDGGATWTVVRDFTIQVNDIAVDPSDGNRLYVAVLDEGLFRSENGGQSFTAVAPATPGIWAVGASANGTTVYYANSLGEFFRSTDRGQTWTQRTSTQQTVARIVVDATNPDSIFAVRGPFIDRKSNV